MSDVTIDVHDYHQDVLRKMAQEYANNKGIPVPSLKKMVEAFFVMGLSRTLQTDGEPPEGYGYDEFVPREAWENSNTLDASEPDSG